MLGSVRRPGLGFTLVLAVVILVTFACRGGDGDNSNGGSGPDQAQATQTPEATETAAPGETPFPTLQPDATLEQLAARFIAGVDGKVSYRYVSNLGFDVEGVWTMYRFSGDSRYDWQTDLGGVESTTTAIIAGDDVYACTQTGGSTSCARDTSGNSPFLTVLFIPVIEIPEAIVAGIPELESMELPDETIAGVKARCFDLVLPNREEIKICFSEDGLLLLMERKVLFEDPSVPPADLSLEAQEVGDASAADFEPPTPVE